VNFAGKYVLTLWGCGTECLMGAALNVTTGKVVWIPFTLCCAGDLSTNDPGFEPIEARKNSRLVVFTGLRNEDGPLASWFYTIEGDHWKLRTSIDRRLG
jgi:hypothetical protein